MPRLEGIMALRGAQPDIRNAWLTIRSTLFDLREEESNIRQGG